LARTGSIADTAKELNVNRTTVSRRLEAFEAIIGGKLFEKLGNQYTPTLIGHQILKIAEKADEQFTQLERQIFGQDSKLEGRLRVSASLHIVSYLLKGALVAFADQYPNIIVDLTITNDFIDLGNFESEVVIRITKSPPMTLVGRAVGPIAFALYDAVDANRAPEGDDALVDKYIGISPTINVAKEIKRNFPNLKVVANVNDLVATSELVTAGLGIGQLPCFMGDTDSRLVRRSEPLRASGRKLWVLTHPDLRHTSRVKVFTDFMYQALKAQMSSIRGEDVGNYKEQ